MNLTNEDRELLDRHFEHDLTDQEETIFQQKLTDDEAFRQAFRLRELIHERVEVFGAAQLKESLKSQLSAMREETEITDEQVEIEEIPVRSLHDTISAARWMIAASIVAVIAAGILFLHNRSDAPDGAAIATQDDTKTENPVSGGQVPAPSYGGTDTYTSAYPIATDQSQQVAEAVLIIDESRTAAAYRVSPDTLFVYYPQDIYVETLQLTDDENTVILQINDDRYRLSLSGNDTEQPLRPLE